MTVSGAVVIMEDVCWEAYSELPGAKSPGPAQLNCEVGREDKEQMSSALLSRQNMPAW